ncbi:MAG: beta-glucosidase [Flavobacteriales bacterium]
MMQKLIILASVFFAFTSCNQEQNSTNKESKRFDSTASEINDPEIDKLIANMSIEEKVGQMTQINLDVISVGEVFNLKEPHELDSVKLDSAINHYYVGSVLNVGGHTYSREHWEEIITELQGTAIAEGNNIPIIYGIDAIHGVNYTADATLFPQQIAQAATWNPALIEEGASVTAYECRASGIPWNFSPVLDIGRQPLWSRFFETYGEDVYLAERMTEACIQGYQGPDPSNPEKVAACMKHFLGYSTPLSGKDRTPAWIPERQLREYFLPTFQEAIKQNALTIMINSGELNGIPVHADHEILTTLLRDELGFKGLAVTDWEDIIKLYRDHKVAVDMRDAVKMAIDAGIDMSMTPNDYSFNIALIDLVKSGEIAESRLDLSCRRILWVKKQLGLMDNPMPDFASYTKFASDEHKESARNTARESITLLKNEGDLLPLSAAQNIFLCGPSANSLNVQNGAWTHTWQGIDQTYNTKGVKTLMESIKESSEGQVEFILGSDLLEEKNIAEAASAARSAEVIVIGLGETPSTEKPGDIEDLTLPQAQINLVKELNKLGKPMVFVLMFNRPRIISEIEPLADAILHAYLPGDYGGEALAEVIYGKVNPSGHLPFTYPKHTGSFVSYDHKYTETLDAKFGRDAFNPQYEFGFGMSYADFSYSNLKSDKSTYSEADVIKVSVDVKNTSGVTGKDVVQVYVNDHVASITPSVKRLRGFQKVEIAAGAQETVTIEIPVENLSFVDKNNDWIIEKGTFTILVEGNQIEIEVK